ncbi:hypothetical protein CDD82_1623 [Ophiocordyceps australis]|uniref:protein-ribulosamine 3-kinase n=1 Tax=Ophiocordyceps australis TaxID=1399860 RepID=A0A2C5ZVA7_9HYPO|nr:hypothetical protein CDD82_1623 [Ophiocordyceps australis]
MPSTVDAAIIDALGLDAANTTMTAHAGSAFSSTFKLSSTLDGRPVDYFVKTGTGPASDLMFRGEHASLNAIHSVVPDLCPQSHAHGAMSTPDEFFLATDFVHFGGREAPDAPRLSLAAKLAKLHSTPAPTPSGHAGPAFGFPVPTCCGSTPQDNSWRASWADFYANNRLRAIMRACAASNGADAELTQAVERVASHVVPRLIGDNRVAAIVPVVVHGDLWSGNQACGRIASRSGSEHIIFDPSAVYAHSEYELGIMHMFGGFSSAFWSEYHELVPKMEPQSEWRDRVLLYELYHHLNHLALFGGGYRGGAMSIMKKLTAKYGSG